MKSASRSREPSAISVSIGALRAHASGEQCGRNQHHQACHGRNRAGGNAHVQESPTKVSGKGERKAAQAQIGGETRARESGLRYEAEAAWSKIPRRSSLLHAPAWRRRPPAIRSCSRRACHSRTQSRDSRAEFPAAAGGRSDLPSARKSAARTAPRVLVRPAEYSCRALRAARGIDASAMDGKLSGSHHREDHPARPHHQFAGLGKHRRKQVAMAADIADAFQHRRKIHEIARPQTGRQRRRAARQISCHRSGWPTPEMTERSRQTRHRAQKCGDHSSDPGADHQVHRPCRRRQRIRNQHFSRRRDIRDHRIAGRLEERHHGRFRQQQADKPARQSKQNAPTASPAPRRSGPDRLRS